MIASTTALVSVPAALRDPLLEEYRNIVQNFMERKWTPSELSGGKFCEIVYTVLDGHAKGTYAFGPFKPANMVDACRKLEKNAHVPRSFQILIPRMLPCLYEIRNNRNVGHVGGDVDPNHMDATAVLSMCSWIMAELIRVLHDVSTQEAQEAVDALVERRVPLVWQIGDLKRVLNPKLPVRDQMLLLLASSSAPVAIEDLFNWLDYKDRGYFSKVLRELHQNRYIEVSKANKTAEILPPGAEYVAKITAPS